MQQPTLMFFKVTVSDNCNYAFISDSDQLVKFLRGLDVVEIQALESWFNKNYAEKFYLRLKIETDSESYRLCLTRLQRAETFWHLDNLQERIDELVKVEKAISEHIDYLLDNTKF